MGNYRNLLEDMNTAESNNQLNDTTGRLKDLDCIKFTVAPVDGFCAYSYDKKITILPTRLKFIFLGDPSSISQTVVLSELLYKILTLRSLTLYIYGAPILDVSRSHTTTQHSR